jgi:ubiquitin-conjugating enzyme E2 Z
MSHIEAIISTLEEEEPAYDPREIVHPEATKLYWGSSTADKKQFNRKLRRSVQDSMEYVHSSGDEQFVHQD